MKRFGLFFTILFLAIYAMANFVPTLGLSGGKALADTWTYSGTNTLGEADGNLYIIDNGSDNAATNGTCTSSGGNTVSQNTYRFPCNGNVFIDVNTCNPSQGTLNLNGKTSAITISGYQAAAAQSTTLTCSSTATPTGPESASTEVINVAADFTGLSPSVADGTVLGPITFSLYQGATQTGTAQTAQTNSECVKTDASTSSAFATCTTVENQSASINAQFTGIAPGTYTICTTAITGCQTVVKIKGTALTVTFNGNASSQALNTTGGGNQSPQCESSGFSLSWAFCPIINGLADATDGIYDNIIQPLLQTTSINVTNPSADPTHLYEIWSNFRIYGDVLLVVALLVVVFGEAIGGGLIDAYTARKMLPRILVAAILINLSIYIVAAMVDITNILGSGIIDLLTAPFKDAGGFSLRLPGTISGIGLAAAIGGIYAAIKLGGDAATVIALFVVLPALFAILGVVVTILIRRGLIIFLILVSPVAFALYVLPNTERYFRKWWDLLFRTLLVYPIIALLFGIAKILAVTINSAGSTGAVTGALSSVMSVVALFLPLFLVPWAFRFAGGVIGTIHETVDNHRKRAHGLVMGDARNPDSLRNSVMRGFNVKRANTNLTGRAINARINPTTMFGQRRELRNARLAGIKTSRNFELGNEIAQNSALYNTYKDDDKVMGDLFKYDSPEASRAAIAADFKSKNDEAAKMLQKGNVEIDSKDDKAAKMLRMRAITQTQHDQIVAKNQQDRGQLRAQYDQSLVKNQQDRSQLLIASAMADKIGRNSATRRSAGMQSSTIGYALAPGQEGWNDAVATMREISGATVARKMDQNGNMVLDLDADGNIKSSGGDDNMFRNMVNQFQFVAKNVGRADLAGNVDSDKYNAERAIGSWNAYEIATAKPAAVKGFSDYWTRAYRAALVDNNLEGMTQARKVLYNLKEAKSNAKGSVGTAINEAIAQYEGIDAERSDTFERIERRDPRRASMLRANYSLADQTAQKQASRFRQEDYGSDPTRLGGGTPPDSGAPGGGAPGGH